MYSSTKFQKPVDCSGRHEDSSGIAAEMLRPRSAQREEAQLRPAESEVPGTEINTHNKQIPEKPLFLKK